MHTRLTKGQNQLHGSLDIHSFNPARVDRKTLQMKGITIGARLNAESEFIVSPKPSRIDIATVTNPQSLLTALTS